MKKSSIMFWVGIGIIILAGIFNQFGYGRICEGCIFGGLFTLIASSFVWMAESN